jgi:hypothetical protein
MQGKNNKIGLPNELKKAWGTVRSQMKDGHLA